VFKEDLKCLCIPLSMMWKGRSVDDDIPVRAVFCWEVVQRSTDLRY
jgi:hypothetical protein